MIFVLASGGVIHTIDGDHDVWGVLISPMSIVELIACKNASFRLLTFSGFPANMPFHIPGIVGAETREATVASVQVVNAFQCPTIRHCYALQQWSLNGIT